MHLFLHNSGALEANQSDDVLYIVSFTFKFGKQKMASPFFLQINEQFLILYDLELRNLCFMFSD